MALHLLFEFSRKPARKPKVILMKEAGPVADGFAQTEIADGHPVSEPAGSEQPKGKISGKTTNNIERAVSRAIVDDHQLDRVVMLAAHTLECCGDEPLTVVGRHNH